MSVTALSTPPMKVARTGLACAFALASFFPLFVTSNALAADPRCMTSYENAQLLRQRGKLVDARDAALVCARPACPEVARKDCTSWVSEIETQIPTVIVIARDEATGDEGGAHVLVDGAARSEAGSGRAFPLDPGAHVFRIERAGDEPLEQTITIVQGEHDRILRFALHSDPTRVVAPRNVVAPSLQPQPPQDVAPATPNASPRSVTYVPAITVGAISVVSFAASAFLGLTGRSDLSHLRTTCAPTCSDGEVDPVRAKLVASDVTLGVGIVGSVIALYLFARPPSTSVASTSLASTSFASRAHVDFAPSLSGAGGAMRIAGSF